MNVGLPGSLTTFSSLTWETYNRLGDGEWARAGLDVGLSLAAGVAGVRLGIVAAPLVGVVR